MPVNKSNASLIRLLQISDSAFPSGSFAFSNGLETLHKELHILDKLTLIEILNEQLLPRWLEFDRFFIRSAINCGDDITKLVNLDSECHLQNTNAALAESSRRIGRSLLTVHKKMATAGAEKFWNACSTSILNNEAGYQPVVIGLVASGLDLSEQEAEIGALYGAISTFFSSAIRLNLIGAIEAQRLIAKEIPNLDARLQSSLCSYPYSSALLSEIAASRHQYLELSLFSN